MAVYWIGQDGNAWYKGDDGVVKNYGVADAGSDDSQFRIYKEGYGNLSIPATRIDDPNRPTQPAPTGDDGGGGGAQKVLNQAAIDNTNKAIASLDDELNVGYGNIDRDYGKVMSGYDFERGNTRKEYEEEGVANTNDLQRNKQNALVAGAQGLRGLRGVLASIGALSGDGGALANRAVTAEANQDIGQATDTAAENAGTLDKAWNRFDEEDKRRRQEAEDAKINNRTALEGGVEGKRQSFFQKIAELYGEAGNTGAATEWLNKAGDLNSVIAAKGGRVATPIAAKTAAFTPGELETYLAGAGDMTVEVAPSTPGGGPGGPSTVLAGRQREEEERRKKLALAV